MLDLSVFQQRVLSLITIVIFIILGINRGELDLAFSEFLVNANSGFGKFISEFGELPGWGVIMVASISAILLRIEYRSMHFVGAVITLVAALVASYYRIGFFVFLFAGIMGLIAYYLVERSNLSRGAILDFSKITGLMLIFLPGIITQIIKSSFGRTRFKNLLSDHSDFTPWYKINGLTGERSFPSGHVSMAIMVFPLMVLINASNMRDTPKIILSSILIIWSVLVAYGRMVVGAHYLTDVLFSIFVGIIGYNYLVSKNHSDMGLI